MTRFPRNVRVTYTDGTTELVPLPETAFGLHGTLAHGPVVSATLAEREDDLGVEDANLGRRPNALERSSRPLPIYGTGRNREAA